MFRFEEPLYLYLLLLIPLLAGLHYATNYYRKKRLLRYGDIELLNGLMPDVSAVRREVKTWLMLAALALLIFTLARPQFGTKMDTRKRQGIEAIIAMDISNSMMAEDVTPSRLEKSKMLVSNIVDKMTDDKVGLIVYAGEAYIKQAIDLAMKSFTPNQDVSKAIFVITDGEDNEGGVVEMAKAAAEKGIKVYVLGVGSPQGAPIPMPGSSQYITDNTGNVVVSKLNEAMCREIAAAGQGAYIYVDNSSSAQEQLSGYVDKLAKKEMESAVYSEYDEQFQAVALLVLLVLVLDVLIVERKNPLFKNIKLFRK